MSFDYKAGIAYGYAMTHEEFTKNSYQLNHSCMDWDEICDDYVIRTDYYSHDGDIIFGINVAICSEGMSSRLHDIIPDERDMTNITCLFKEYFPDLKDKTPGLHLYLEIS